MPLIPDESVTERGGVLGISPHDKPEPGYLDLIGASLGSESPLVSPFVDKTAIDDFYSVDKEFKPFEDIEGYEDDANDGAFDDVFNARAHTAVKAQLDAERQRERVKAMYPVSSAVTDTVASLFSPTTLVPGGALIRAGRVGYSAGKSAFAVGATAGGAAALDETVLQTTQRTRTSTESGLAIGASVALGAILGGGLAKHFTKAEWDKGAASIEARLAGEIDPREKAQIILQRYHDAGAAAAETVDISDLDIGGGKAAQIAADIGEFAGLVPGIQVSRSSSLEARKAYHQLVGAPYYTAMNLDGRTMGPAVEDIIKITARGTYGEWVKTHRALYRQARKAGYEGRLPQFNEDVTRAGRRNDIDPNGNEFVTKAAQSTRVMGFDPLAARAVKAGLLPENMQVRTAASYVSRIWNRQKVIAREEEFRAIVSQHIRAEMNALDPKEAVDFVSKADAESYIEEVITSIIDNITGRGAGDIPDWIIPTTRGPLKSRVFNIADELVEGFLENDADLIMRRYMHTMTAEIELTNRFGRADMADQIRAIKNEFTDKARAATSEKERMALDKERRTTIRNLEAFRDKVRGTYRLVENRTTTARVSNVAKTFSYMVDLGGVTLSSMGDPIRPIMVSGLRAVAKQALPILAGATKQIKIAKREAAIFGPATERITQTRLASLADLNDPYMYGSKIERFVSNASNIFTKATFLGWWNDTWKELSSVMAQSRMADNILNRSGMDKYERNFMAFSGIDEIYFDRVAVQVAKHGERDGFGVWGLGLDSWDDPAVAQIMGAAMNKSADATIVTKGVGDTPLWMDGPVASAMMQFKSFAIASHSRVLLRGLQERPLRFMEGLIGMSTLGMMIAWIKLQERGDHERAQRLLDNPGLLISEGLDRSGIFSVLLDASNTLEKLGSPVGVTQGLQALFDDEDRGGPLSRYASRGVAGAIGGPTLGKIDAVVKLLGQMAKGDITEAGVNSGVKLIPGRSLPGVRTGMELGLKPWAKGVVE